MMLNGGILVLTYIDGTPITGVSDKFNNALDYNVTSGQTLNINSSPPRGVKCLVVCKAVCTEAYWYNQGITVANMKLALRGGGLYLNDNLNVVPWANARNVGDSFNSYFMFDSLPQFLKFRTKGQGVQGGALVYELIDSHGVYQISVRIYF